MRQNIITDQHGGAFKTKKHCKTESLPHLSIQVRAYEKEKKMNQKNNWLTWWTLLIILSVILAACAPAVTPTAAPAATDAPAQPAATEAPVQPAATEAPAQPAATEAPTQPTAEPAEEQIVLKVMDNWGAQVDAKGPPLQSIFEDFMKAYPNIKIEEEVFADTDIPTKVSTAFLAGEEPDIVFQNYPYLTKDWLKDGITIPVTDLMEQWGLKDGFKDEALAQYTDETGALVAFPLEGFTWPVWYNMKIMKEAGVDQIPTTIDELIAASEKIRAAGYQPLVIAGADWPGQGFFNVVNSATMTNEEFGEVYSKGGFSESESFVKSVELFVKLRDAGVFADDSEGLDASAMVQQFYTEKAAMAHLGSWSFSEAPPEMVDDIIVSGFPIPEDSPWEKPILLAGYIGKGVWITRNGAKKLDAVEKFIKFFFQPEMIDRFVETAGMTSPLKKTEVDESKLNPLYVQTLNWGDSVNYVDAVDSYIPVTAWEDLTNITKEAFIPGTTVQQILDALDAAWKRILQ